MINGTIDATNEGSERPVLGEDFCLWLGRQDMPSPCRTRLRHLSDCHCIDTVGQVCTFTEAEILRYPNVGTRSLGHLRRCLKAEGLHLRDEEPAELRYERQLILELWAFIERVTDDRNRRGRFLALRELVFAFKPD